jgi:hypothetical protein
MDYELRKACERGECAQALQLIKSSGWRDEFAVLGPDEAVFDRAVRWRDGEYDGWRSPDDPILTTRGEPPVPKWCLWLPLVQLFDDAGAPLPRGAWKVRWSDGTEIITPRSDVRICHTAHARLNTEGLPATPLILACTAAGLPVVTKGGLALARALLDAGHAVDVRTPSGTALVPHPNSFRRIPSPAVMELLLDRGADIEQTNSRGKTALWVGSRGHGMEARAATSCAGRRRGSPDAFGSDATDDGVRRRRLSDYGDPPAPRSGRRREPDVHWAITL